MWRSIPHNVAVSVWTIRRIAAPHATHASSAPEPACTWNPSAAVLSSGRRGLCRMWPQGHAVLKLAVHALTPADERLSGPRLHRCILSCVVLVYADPGVPPPCNFRWPPKDRWQEHVAAIAGAAHWAGMHCSR